MLFFYCNTHETNLLPNNHVTIRYQFWVSTRWKFHFQLEELFNRKTRARNRTQSNASLFLQNDFKFLKFLFNIFYSKSKKFGYNSFCFSKNEIELLEVLAKVSKRNSIRVNPSNSKQIRKNLSLVWCESVNPNESELGLIWTEFFIQINPNKSRSGWFRFIWIEKFRKGIQSEWIRVISNQYEKLWVLFDANRSIRMNPNSGWSEPNFLSKLIRINPGRDDLDSFGLKSSGKEFNPSESE